MLHFPRPLLALALPALLAANTLPNGLQLVRFDVRLPDPAVAGASVTVEFTLKNLSSDPMQFDAEGIFIGARVNSTSDANNRDFGRAHQRLRLAPGREVTVRASRTLDAAGQWRFWPAFRLRGQWGPFRWMEKTATVYASAAEARTRPATNGETVTVAQLLANPARYDARRVTVVGDAMIVRRQKGSSGAPWTLISLVDIENKRKVMSVIAPGRATLSNGDVARATGVFRVNSRRGRYTFHNELICEEGGVLRDQRQTAQKEADRAADSRAPLRVKEIVQRQFQFARLGRRLIPLGSNAQVRFQTRTYSQTPRRDTVVATGAGAAAIRVEAVERRAKPGGGGSTPAGRGMTWLIVRVWLRGSASNTGEPGNFDQSPFYFDPPPVFFIAGADGAVYWPDYSWSSSVAYQTKTDKTMNNIPTNASGWSRSALTIRIPLTLQQPVLVAMTHQGDGRFEYTGFRLY